jgi:hypothetical protein
MGRSLLQVHCKYHIGDGQPAAAPPQKNPAKAEPAEPSDDIF